jgi:indoleamine 2,3-dioxygenase
MLRHQLRLADFGLSPISGFLPEPPVSQPAQANAAWHGLAADLPKKSLLGGIRAQIEALPPYQPDPLTPTELQMRTLSYLGHAYLWGEPTPTERLPASLAQPWAAVADAAGRPPILSYPSYCLFNFRKIDPAKPAFLGNVEIVQNFLGGADEDWFILIHVDIEARAAPALRAIPDLLAAADEGDDSTLKTGLHAVHGALLAMNATMNRMPEACDPYIYYTRVRPYIFGTKNNPAVPNGVVYEGCFNDEPQHFRGETGAQSGIVPALDALLGIGHENDPLKEYLLEMRGYMVPAHRRFVEVIEETSALRERVLASPDPALRGGYDACVDELFRFRAKHLEYAAAYIHRQAAQAHNSTAVGTGGTPFMQYLAKHRDETRRAGVG